MPDHSGPLSKVVSSSSLAVANAKVADMLEGSSKPRGQYIYIKLTAELRAEIGREQQNMV